MSWYSFDKFQHMWRIYYSENSFIADNNMVDKLVEIGYNPTHASNTLSSEKGGLTSRLLCPTL